MATRTDTPRRALWYHGWNVVAGASLAQMVSISMTVYCLSLFLVPWSREFDVPISRILFAMIPMIIVSGVVSPPLGALADKYPARWVMGTGMVGMALGCLVMSQITEVWHIWALYTWFPIPAVLCGILPGSTVVSRWFVKRAAVALGLMSFGKGIAGMIVPPLIASVLPEVGWRDVWFYVGLAMLVMTVLSLIPLRDRPEARDGFDYVGGADPSAPPVGAHGAGHRPASDAASDLRWGTIFRNRTFWLVVGFFLPVLSLLLGVQQNLAPLATRLGLPGTSGGTLVAAFSASVAISTMLVSFASDRFGNRRAMIGVALMTGAGALVIGFGETFPALLLGAVMCAVGAGMWPLLPVAMAAEFGARGVGRAFGAIMMLPPLCAAVPSLVAHAQETFGSYAPAMVVLAAGSLLAAVSAALLRPPSAAAAPAPAAA